MSASNRIAFAIAGLAVLSVAASMAAMALLKQPPISASASAPSSSGPAQPSMDVIIARVEALERRLEADPDDLEGWKMLGRSFMAIDRPREAVGAWSRAAQLAPSDPDVRAALAQLMDLARQRGAHEEEPARAPGELSPSR